MNLPKTFSAFVTMVAVAAQDRDFVLRAWTATHGMDTGRRVIEQLRSMSRRDGEAFMKVSPETAEAPIAYAKEAGIEVGEPPVNIAGESVSFLGEAPSDCSLLASS